MTELSLEQAQHLVLHAQRLATVDVKNDTLQSTLHLIEQLGYIQIDTISVVQRAHHHTLWVRNPQYKPEHIDKLLEEKKVFEYWSHAAAYLPMREYRFSLYFKAGFIKGEQKHWFKRDQRMMQYVLDRIKHEGPLMAKDFDDKGEKPGEWGSKLSKQALENLFMEGQLMVSRRERRQQTEKIKDRYTSNAGVDVFRFSRDSSFIL